ncbi:MULTISPECIES: helix-turn-helix transcriptional regulator [unclassified Cytobacillus]|uniref:helix-turn-helix transcriptional regulator n=1 Tax=unclassified Cytobacillus TaxID=2675268 RepID=UPI0013583536|nr:helix-turn-helix transcriptional regulator [Cytobacillus sp. AMY 15.2]KAF0817645.1 hypothetical protein KIS4809_3462 [Bacillus sp. ZZV12-4809]MCM3092179.1 helix-turn-helix transcriptional regulator [Cytobacillus sp. AMY 15.2]
MNFGQVLKLHRIKLKMTQAEVASDICSIPHLSKIENGSKEVNKETLFLLLKKVGLKYEDIIIDQKLAVEKIKHLSKEIYFCNYNEAKTILDNIRLKEEQYVSYGLGPKIYLEMCRYFIHENNIESANKYYKLLTKMKKSLLPEELESLTFIQGLLALKQGNLIESLRYFNKCLDYNSLDQGDVQYYFGLVSGRTGNFGEAIEAAIKAKGLFMQTYNYKRINHVKLLLGITLAELGTYNKAELYFKEVIYNSKILKDKEIESIASHNYGLILKKKGDYKLAKEILNESLNFHKDNNKQERYLDNLTELAEIYIIEKEDISNSLIEEILLLSDLHKKDEYFHIFYIYKLLLKKEYEKMEEYILKEAIPYFELHNQKKHLIFCYRKLEKYCIDSFTLSEIKSLFKNSISLFE